MGPFVLTQLAALSPQPPAATHREYATGGESLIAETTTRQYIIDDVFVCETI